MREVYEALLSVALQPSMYSRISCSTNAAQMAYGGNLETGTDHGSLWVLRGEL